jgi:hypothetical protein
MTGKKIKIILIIFLIFFSAVGISAFLSNELYFQKIASAEAKKRKMDKKAANAIKHAYAASLSYSVLRRFYFSENAAENIVVFLGKANEISEIFFKSKKDSTLEMMKDLNNNLVGIYAAKWLEKNKNQYKNQFPGGQLNLIGDLAENKILMLLRSEIILSETQKPAVQSPPSYFLAVDWFEENKIKIASRTQEFFEFYQPVLASQSE